jgi:hypothetical protein
MEPVHPRTAQQSSRNGPGAGRLQREIHLAIPAFAM